MITRIVQMTFQPDKAKEFLEIFDRSKKEIRNFDGCLHLELLQDANNKNVYITFSQWQSDTDLQQYRESELFRATWEQTKKLFSEKAIAKTLESLVKV